MDNFWSFLVVLFFYGGTLTVALFLLCVMGRMVGQCYRRSQLWLASLRLMRNPQISKREAWRIARRFARQQGQGWRGLVVEKRRGYYLVHTMAWTRNGHGLISVSMADGAILAFRFPNRVSRRRLDRLLKGIVTIEAQDGGYRVVA